MEQPFVVAFIVLVAAGVLARRATPALRRSAAHAHARRIDLRLEPADEDAVATRLARRTCAGVLAGAALGVLTAVVLGRSGVEDFGWSPTWLSFLAFFLGTALGSAGVAWYESSRPLAAGPRVARATVPSHADYVPRVERWGARAMAVLSALVALGLVVLDGTGLVELGDLPGALVAVTIVGPALAVLADELAARWLIGRRQVAASPLALAWDDALRAGTLRDSVTVAICASAFAPFVLLGVVGDGLEGGWPANPGVGVITGAFLVLLLVLVGVGIASLAVQPEKHFRRRLWSVGTPGAAEVAIGGAR
ncbi:hypothetical protein ICW40_06075 [Actinotalea ferrariae]|uniref:hypothetical protein n=1 Tax=Actinotalea ferrariae TaxID=1386098 RepID=UPI001C8BB824|nr:hypothetical protein [Actinotalea ferrariae]MBX9244372.1 hypothetical protein [Actinotalea ferrariae]